ncbi:MAG TPA: multidrug RND transporter [bacterium]|nr:multidrug RND transporter [bacterium]
MREKLLKKLAALHTNHPWRMLLIVFVLTIIFIGLSERLSVTMRWSDLLPSDDRRTIQFNQIIEKFVSATSIIVVVQGEESRMKQFADELAPKLLTAVDTSQNSKIDQKVSELNEKIHELKDKDSKQDDIEKLLAEIASLKAKQNRPIIKRVDYKTEVDFLKNHGLMLMKENDLRNLKDAFTDPNLSGFLTNLNNSMEKEYIGQSESISTREKEDQAVMFLDGIQRLVKVLEKYGQNKKVTESEAKTLVDKLLIGEPYFLSYDEKALVMNAIPNFTMFDTDLLVSGTEAVQSILDEQLKKYPDLKAGLTGFVPIGHDEMVYSQRSLGYTTLIAIIAILALLIISLRMWFAPLFAIFNLLIGIIWAIGIAAAVVGQLNIMTQMMAVILLGLGIDFSIHIISGFKEWRAAGDSIGVAMEKTFMKSGKGVVTGALTTALAFLTMMISSSRGMKEMGIVTGLGLLAILLTTMLLLPTILTLWEKFTVWIRSKGKGEAYQKTRDLSFNFLGKTCESLSKHYLFSLTAVAIVTILMIWSATNITFDQNYLNIEPKGLTSIELQDTIIDKFDLDMNYALVIGDSVEESRTLAEDYRNLGTVARTEDISLYLPSDLKQKKRIPHIRDIKKAMKFASVRSRVSANELLKIKQEIERLEMNIMEMQDMAYIGGQDRVDDKCKQIIGSPTNSDSKNLIKQLLNILNNSSINQQIQGFSHFQKGVSPYFKKSVMQMCTTDPIDLNELPESIIDRYCNQSRNKFLVTVYPAGSLWTDSDFFRRFVDDIESVSDKVTGMPPVFRALIDIIGREGRNAIFFTLVIVFGLLWLDFGKPKYALMAMVPLGIGVFWMVGLMYLTGQQFTVMNVMGLPMIIGIGIDDGVHIVHRWLHEGKGKVRTIFASTGKAILLTSLTTMLAFGSLIFSIWRGFGHLGAALFVGVAGCFLTTVLILPGIIGWMEKNK